MNILVKKVIKSAYAGDKSRWQRKQRAELESNVVRRIHVVAVVAYNEGTRLVAGAA